MPSRLSRSSRMPRLFAVLFGLVAFSGCKEPNHYAAPPPPHVTVAVPAQQKVRPYLELTGSTAPVNSVDLVARVAGVLQDISYTDGDEVKRGKLLFTIEPPPYAAKMEQAKAAEAGAQAQFAQADAEYKRQAQLGQRDVSSQSTVDQARAARDTAQASVLQAKANTEIAAMNYGYTRVFAPFDGVVTAHLVSTGALVGTPNPTKLASLVQLDPIYVNFNVSEPDVQRIHTDLTQRGLTLRDIGQVTVEAGLQTETGYPHEGRLDYVAPDIDQSTGTLLVRAVFANPGRSLLPGYFVRVRVPSGKPQDVLLVPETALGSDQGGRYVLVVNGANVVEQHRVAVGSPVGEMRVVESGLKPTDKVVVDGLQRATPGQRVDPRLQTAAAAPPPSVPQ